GRGARAPARAVARCESRGHRRVQPPHRARRHADRPRPRVRGQGRGMSQFVAYVNADPVSRQLIPYLLDVQSDLIETIGSRVVVPLITSERAGVVMDRLMPCLAV